MLTKRSAQIKYIITSCMCGLLDGNYEPRYLLNFKNEILVSIFVLIPDIYCGKILEIVPLCKQRWNGIVNEDPRPIIG